MLPCPMAEEVVVIAKPNTTRRRAIEGALGVLAGIVFACVNGPWLLSLLYTSPRGNTLCGNDVNDALAYFVKLQLIFGVLGGSFLLAVSFFLRRVVRKRREAGTLPST
jgi:hypothetical protein